MKVLIVTHHYLHGNGGGVFASRCYINALATLCDDVTLMCPLKDGFPPEHIHPRVRVIPVPDRRPVLKKAIDLLTGRFHRFASDFPALLSRERFDMIVFDTCYPAGDLASRAKGSGARVVTIHHNWQYAYEKDNARGVTRPFILLWMRRCERTAVHGSDLNITLTEQDRETLYQQYDPARSCRICVCPPFEYE